MEQECRDQKDLHRKSVTLATLLGDEHMCQLLRGINPSKVTPAEEVAMRGYLSDYRMGEQVVATTQRVAKTTTVMKLEGTAYIISVRLVAEASDADDRAEKPEGCYLVFAPSGEEALDQFHLQVPIGCLDDYLIWCNQVNVKQAGNV